MDKIKKIDILYYIVKNIFICFLVIFLGIYISVSSGNSNYKAYKRSELTKDAIKRFEEDVKNGKNINLNDYIDVNETTYSNKVSKAGIYLSNKITVFAKDFIRFVGNVFSVVFEE